MDGLDEIFGRFRAFLGKTAAVGMLFLVVLFFLFICVFGVNDAGMLVLFAMFSGLT